MKINPKAYHAALIFYCAAIFIFSSIPGEELPKVDFKFSDKIVHLVIYAILFILFFYSLKNQSKSVKLQKFALEYSVLFTAVYGITDELHQYFVPNRSCELDDWISDVVGALLIYGIFKIYYSQKKKYIIVILLIALCGCMPSNKLNQNEKIIVSIAEQEVWLNLMPVIGENVNILGFILRLNLKTESADSNYSIRNFNIYLDNDTLVDKKIETEFFVTDPKTKQLNIFQSKGEMYIGKNKELPEEAQFSFALFEDDKKIKTIKSSKLKINRVY